MEKLIYLITGNVTTRRSLVTHMEIEELIAPLEGHELRSCHCSMNEMMMIRPPGVTPLEDLAKLIKQVKTGK
jgi:hypothetical protein